MANSAVDFEKSLLQTLKNDTNISKMVGNKVFALYIPEGTKLPCITFQRISGKPANTLGGASGLESIELQIDTWGRTFNEAKTLAKYVRQAMPARGAEWGAHLNQDHDFFVEDSSYFRVNMLYTVWYLENFNE